MSLVGGVFGIGLGLGFRIEWAAVSEWHSAAWGLSME